MTNTSAAAGRLVLGFDGTRVPEWIGDLGPESRPAGFLLGRYWNVADVAQLRRLTAGLQALADPHEPFLIMADEEGGQLSAFSGIVTAFPGNMALGAIGDAQVAEEVARVTGTELRALGVNTVLAPVVDVATNPDNPSLGIRSFGDDPALVASLGAAMVRGYRSSGVAATAKHYPGKGEAAVDPHDHLPHLAVDKPHLDTVEFPPFRAAAGADMLMIGHYAVPSLTGRADVPVSVLPELRSMVASTTGYGGVVVSDALDMGAFTASGDMPSLAAAVDLLLCARDRSQHAAAEEAVRSAPADLTEASLNRIRALRQSLVSDQPAATEVGSSNHRDLAAEVSRQALTLVRYGGGLPINPEDRVLAIMPKPADLTPADTSSLHPADLGRHLRWHYSHVGEIVTPTDPTSADIAAACAQAGAYDTVVVATTAARSLTGQAALVRGLLAVHTRVVVVALRTPYDLTAYPEASTYICTYSLAPPSLAALADALFVAPVFPGRLPAAIPGLYPRGHGLDVAEGGAHG